MGRSWGLRVSSLLFALRLTLELPKASATTPLAQKRRIYVLPFFNLPCMYDTQSTLRTITSKNPRYILSMVEISMSLNAVDVETRELWRLGAQSLVIYAAVRARWQPI